LKILGAPATAKPCRGMAGLVDEGEEVMSEGKDKDDAPADLALIGAAQRVEHYEIAAYTTARNLAFQLHQPAIVRLLTMSLGEEQNAGQLLDQIAQPLMSVTKMPASVE
jgi:Mn-containing catalase